MENMCIQFEPFISDDERKFIVDGIDYYNVAATGLPDWFPINFVLRGERGDVLRKVGDGAISTRSRLISRAIRRLSAAPCRNISTRSVD